MNLVHDFPVVWAYGAGQDSTAGIVGWHARGLRVPAAILFADTGDEKPETYAYIDIFNEYLRSIGYPTITVVRNASPVARDMSLSAECMRKGVLPSLAYGRGGHSCSIKWKLDPQVKWCKAHFGWTRPRKARGASERPAGTWRHGPWIYKAIGYDAGPGDARRISKARDKWPDGHWNIYPLAEWGWDRARCVEEIQKAGLPVPVKSACFMCPASKKHEIHWLRDRHPQLHERALKLEALAAPKLTSTPGLGRTFAWKDL